MSAELTEPDFGDITFGPAYDYDDPERVEFVRENAAVLLRDRDHQLARLRKQITYLQKSRDTHRAEARRLQTLQQQRLEKNAQYDCGLRICPYGKRLYAVKHGNGPSSARDTPSQAHTQAGADLG